MKVNLYQRDDGAFAKAEVGTKYDGELRKSASFIFLTTEELTLPPPPPKMVRREVDARMSSTCAGHFYADTDEPFMKVVPLTAKNLKLSWDEPEETKC